MYNDFLQIFLENNMVKRVLIFTILIVLLLPTAVLANDGAYYSGEEKVGVKIIPSSYHINIGEEFKFTLEIINYTPTPFDWADIEGALIGRIIINDICDVYIEPYRTVQYDITVKIDQEITWYKDGYKYFTTFEPEVYIAVENDNLYYIETSKPITLEIDNIKDGSQYISYEFVDDKEYITYQCRELWPAIGQHKYFGQLDNRMIIKNLTDNKIENITRITSYGGNRTTSLEPFEEIEITAFYSDATSGLYDIPNRVNVQNNLLFKLGDLYYGVAANKNYPALYFDVPKIKMIVIGEKDENGYIERTILSLTNRSEDHIKNFFVDFNGYSPYLPDYIFPIIKAGETIEVELPIYSYNGIPTICDYGYFVEGDDIIICWHNEGTDGGAVYTETDEYETWTDYFGNNLHNYEIQFEYNHHEVEVLIILDEPTNPPYPTPSPTISPEHTETPEITPSLQPTDTIAPTTAPTRTSAPTNTPSAVVVETKELPYVPAWVFIVLLTVFSAMLAIFIYKYRRDINDNKDDR